MKKFKIKILYVTGDSFKTETRDKMLEGSWNNISIVEENLKRIKLHYEWYDKVENKSWVNAKKEKVEVPYCVKIHKQYSYEIGTLLLLTDDNIEYEISPYWTGYFERLISASVEFNMKVEF